MQFLIGCDPELFLSKDGQLVSAHGLIPGDKKTPHAVKAGAVQVDGMAAEFNIDPAKNKEEFAFNILTVMDSLQQMVPDYELEALPTAHFGKEYIDSQPEEAKELGCDPDLNAYTGKPNDTPDAETPFRTGAGHIHIGWTQNASGSVHTDACRMLVKELDIALGLPSLLLDEDSERRMLYGKAGAYREKDYGVEYRVLSNFWLKEDHLIDWVYDTVEQTIKRLAEGELLSEIYPDVEQIINSNDVEAAKAILRAEQLLGGVYEV